jgi:hypothetical protein
MLINHFGIAEILVSFVAVSLSLALPIAVLFLPYKIYAKLRSIEEHLKKE